MKAISAAFVAAKRQFGPALKDRTNPAFRSKYADLGACLEAVEDALLANGIALYQETFDDATGATVETVLLHESGEALRCGKLHVPASKQDPQGYGSALTYARRYSLMAACGIAPEDDDGNAASKPTKQTPAPQAAVAPQATLTREQQEEIAALVSATDSDLIALMQWISKGAGKKCNTLAEVPADAYAPVIKRLNEKKAQTA
jgi:hypothetical protein